MIDGKVRPQRQKSCGTTVKTDECSNAAGALGQNQTKHPGVKLKYQMTDQTGVS